MSLFGKQGSKADSRGLAFHARVFLLPFLRLDGLRQCQNTLAAAHTRENLELPGLASRIFSDIQVLTGGGCER